jgi:hypothetical protein
MGAAGEDGHSWTKTDQGHIGSRMDTVGGRIEDRSRGRERAQKKTEGTTKDRRPTLRKERTS